LTPAELTADVTNLEAVHFADLNDELWQTIEQARSDGKLVLCMGAGTIDGWLRQKLAA
jgi:UDP-N-acetylmuramate-alanine ligase